jgi:hypothetical protein
MATGKRSRAGWVNDENLHVSPVWFEMWRKNILRYASGEFENLHDGTCAKARANIQIYKSMPGVPRSNVQTCMQITWYKTIDMH